VKFGFIKEWLHIWSLGLLCNVMQVTQRGFRKWLTRPMSKRQRGDMKVLAVEAEGLRLFNRQSGSARVIS
jgi:hypothetical protein